MIEINGMANTYFEAELPFAPLPGSTLPTAREMLALGEPPAFVLGPRSTPSCSAIPSTW
jgi:hypothetical protein